MYSFMKKGLSVLLAGIIAVSGAGTAFAADTGSDSIDMSHENPNAWGSSFGIAADAVSRWQSFVATKDGVIDTAEVYLIKMNPDKGEFSDVIASIYPMENGAKSGEALETVTVPADEVLSQGVTSIDFNVSVEEGHQYALSLPRWKLD